MDHFSVLPNEILDLFSTEIQERGSLFSLSLVSKNCYDLFNRRLYEFVCADRQIRPDQIRTFALSQSERMPLIGPHPASFVKTLKLKFIQYEDMEGEEQTPTRLQGDIEEDLFRTQIIPALKNIAEHSGLYRLELFFPNVSLDKGIKDQSSIVFGHLREIIIGCPIPNKKSLDIFESICRGSPSLNYLELNWWRFNYIRDPNVVVRLMGSIPKVCPNLREIQLLHLNDVISEQSRESIQQVFDDPNFTFPLLQKLHCARFMSCNTFLERHLGIENLKCNNSSKSGFIGALPNLRLFHGSVTDYLALCSKYPPPVEYLELDFISTVPRLGAQEEMRLINGLAKTRTLRRFVLNEYRITGISLVLLNAITNACPNLTHFTSRLGKEVSAEPASLSFGCDCFDES
ncbi:hypothetical protein BT96DRAFT_429203 [Gymnopus androsaceus JB14]|uniref:F-box domain-containing protein n=1 Tax=Gymnopus androsaceus JB14 TaxID=1447944 RepID=A0A6A4GU15_9AGAR|nr:hypothetical protein BT96DRAFT_429203 [Gymnopus androsaceus JB14]